MSPVKMEDISSSMKANPSNEVSKMERNRGRKKGENIGRDIMLEQILNDDRKGKENKGKNDDILRKGEGRDIKDLRGILFPNWIENREFGHKYLR